MIEEMVNANCKATIRLILHGVIGEQQEVMTFIDTSLIGRRTPKSKNDRIPT